MAKKQEPTDLFDESFDPLAGLDEPEAEGPKKGRRAKKTGGSKPNKNELKLFKKDKKDKKSSIVRVSDVNDLEEIDTDDVISTYIPRRRIRLIALAFRRLDKMRILLMFALLIVGILFIMSFLQEKMGSFTINLDRLELYRKGVAMDYDPNFSQPTARLVASPVSEATNISIYDLPANLDMINGDHNGVNYMAYTYYVRNAGKEDLHYVATVTLESTSKGADDAVRVAIWKNGERMVYAKPSAGGDPEPGCVNFINDRLVCAIPEDDFLVGNVDKYTIVIWLEGDDPECVDRIVGGSVEFVMKIAAANEEDSTLLQKWIQDIADTIRGDKPINTAGTESPDFQKYQNVTYDTRRNQ